MAAKKNYFGVLDEEDEAKPSFSLAPSVLASARSAIDGFESDDDLGLGPSREFAANSSSAPTTNSAASSSSAISMDLASIANEILVESKQLTAPSAVTAWDFSGLAKTAEDESKRTSKEVEDKQKAHEARLAALASDETLLRERMQRSDMSKNAKKRKFESVGKGEDLVGRLESKVYKRNQSNKMRNKAKNMW